MKNEYVTNDLLKSQLSAYPCYLYRFRTLERILDKKELENQEIYFSSPKKLNDPIESFINLFWKGDTIAWTGLFKHYIMILEQWKLHALIDNNIFLSDKNQLFHNINQLPTQIYKDKILSIYSKFFAHPSIVALIDFLGNRKSKIKRTELQFYLTTTLKFIDELILASNQKYIKNKQSVTNNGDSLKKVLPPSFFSKISEELAQPAGEKFIDTMFDITAPYLDLKHIAFSIALKNYETTKTKKEKISSLMIVDNYFSILESLIFPDWYVACFTQHYGNTAVWGHYSDGHTGVCLKFKTQKLKTEGIGISLTNNLYSNTHSEKFFPFQKTFYKKKYPEINFFKSMGALPRNTIEDWFSDKEGNQSSSTNLMQNEEAWKNDYWKQFSKKNSIKLKEWSYEHEYRLIMASFSRDTKNKNNRIFKYKLSNLEGIIFGIKTPEEKKLDIIKIILDKCKKESREDFKFYQAYYDSHKGLIDVREMKINMHISLLSF